jgi:hypothetical protein
VTTDLRADRASGGDTELDQSFGLGAPGAPSPHDGSERPRLRVAGASYIAAALLGLTVWALVIWWCL